MFENTTKVNDRSIFRVELSMHGDSGCGGGSLAIWGHHAEMGRKRKSNGSLKEKKIKKLMV